MLFSALTHFKKSILTVINTEVNIEALKESKNKYRTN